MRQLNARVPEEDYYALARIAGKSDKTVSDLLRLAIQVIIAESTNDDFNDEEWKTTARKLFSLSPGQLRYALMLSSVMEFFDYLALKNDISVTGIGDTLEIKFVHKGFPIVVCIVRQKTMRATIKMAIMEIDNQITHMIMGGIGYEKTKTQQSSDNNADSGSAGEAGGSGSGIQRDAEQDGTGHDRQEPSEDDISSWFPGASGNTQSDGS